ncbi:hypothetical protein CY34DRAFT_451250 [Suillus luteus UH-Slu-Lm8-n1]|uniref:Uncharacterized protein n=1 Tax=Suillus luteus UH-Slu-Lm8-n1 TaxID=930992 RepID=A0A0D0A7K2_9AGAM|nr:hypothetical protein CY34DRAFT_451250 [Suillus luteus UH-Slu-Lm8-n1]
MTLSKTVHSNSRPRLRHICVYLAYVYFQRRLLRGVGLCDVQRTALGACSEMDSLQVAGERGSPGRGGELKKGVDFWIN